MRGVAFWTEVSVARRAVDAVFGPPTIRSETVFTETPAASPALAPVPAPAPNTQSLGSDACNIHSKAFLDVSCFFHMILFSYKRVEREMILFGYIQNKNDIFEKCLDILCKN
ncbi:hypothetical protein MtrunA17_Chr2g0279681 [Medicago truncatula]|uniref:Uncharacterized protein n=1 Tax=Medicago truncatula TaxID=3880 RepID=A0A396J2V2_MEDTR|nr:hypothetical protein MtrunA17_Chr2g0279681 [Medicago truncatula]